MGGNPPSGEYVTDAMGSCTDHSGLVIVFSASPSTGAAMTAQPISLFPEFEEEEPKPLRQHGSSNGYRLGCRCDDCLDWFYLWQFGSQYMKVKQAQRREFRQRGGSAPRVPLQPVKLTGCKTPSVYTVELHRADREPLCEACVVYLRRLQ